MPERITKAHRWLDLIVFLLRHRLPVTVEQIMEAVPGYMHDWGSGDDKRRESVRRKFERDKDELRALGIPIETVPYSIAGEPTEGYRLKESDLYLPRLLIEGGEGSPAAGGDIGRLPAVEATPERWAALARAAHRVAHLRESPLAPHARSALRKLGFDLPEIAGAADEPYLHFLDVPDPEVAGALEALTEALLGRKEVRFEYYSIARDELRERRAWPYGLLYQGGAWYLIGRDPQADGIRTFRVSRMGSALPNRRSPKTPDYEIPEDFDLRDHVGREAWRLGEDESEEMVAEVLFLPPTSWWAESQGVGEWVREDEPTGGHVRTFRVRQLEPFLRWCLSFRGQARPVEPESVVAGFRELVERALEQHREPEEAADGE